MHEIDDHETGLEVRVLVTGATGFIGLHLVRRLVEAGREVVCLARPTSRCEVLKRMPVRLVEGDVTSGAGLAEGLAGCNVVVHLAGRVAGRTRNDFLRPNADGVRHVVRASGECNSPPVVVLVSSLAAAGPARGGRPLEPGDEPRPVSYYGESKLAGEAEARAFAERVPVTIVRPPIVFGGGDRASFEWFRSVARWRLHVVPGLRAERYSLVYVEDLVGALAAAAERGRRIVAGSDPATRGIGVYYVASDETPTYGEIGDYVAAGLGGRRFLKLPVPKWALRVAGIGGDCMARATGRPALLGSDKVREAVAGSWLCSAATARSELGFVPAKGLAERFASTAAWYRENGWL